MRAAVTDEVGLVLVETVQGEGGVHPATPEFLGAARELDVLLCLDEVQCGLGRTGSFFAWEQVGVRPDLVTLAKGLANGLPIGALLVADETPEGFEPGDHGSTFGGNPVISAAACAVVEAIDDELLANVRDARSPARRGPARRWRLCARFEGGGCCSERSSTVRPPTSSTPAASRASSSSPQGRACSG